MFVRYATARINQHIRDMVYRTYVTDCLALISKNAAYSAGPYGGDGRYMSKRFSEIFNPPPVDNRTGDEIAADIMKKAGLVVKHGST